MIISPIQLRFSDIDMLGHVNNSKYSQYFDIGRLDCLNKLIGDRNNWKGRTLVIVHVESDFFKPVFLSDMVHVQTTITEVGSRSLKMLQRIVDNQGAIRVESRSVMSAFDVQTGQSFVIPDEWRERAKKEDFV